MPSVAEILYYLRGLWLFAKASPSASRYLDFTERGFRRSFWAMAISLPFMVLSSIFMLASSAGSDLLSIRTVFRSVMIEGISWILPLIIYGIICYLASLPRSFQKIVIVTNWFSLPVNIVAAVVITIIAVGSPVLKDLMMIVLQIIALGAYLLEIRFIYLLMEERPLPTAGAIIGSTVMALLLADLGTRYILEM